MNDNPLSNIPSIGPATGMGTPPGASRFKPVDPLRLLRQHMVLLIITAVIGVGLGVGAWAALRVTMPRYTSWAKLKVNGAQTARPDSTVTSTAINPQDIALYIENEVQRIRSHEILRAAIDRPEVRQTSWFARFKTPSGEPNFAAAIQALQNDRLSVYPESGSTLIDIGVNTENPDDARIILQAVIQTYLQQLHIEQEGTSADLRAVFVRQRDQASDEVNQIQARIQRFVSDQDIATDDINHTDAGLKYANLNKQQIDLEIQLDAAQAQYKALADAEQKGNFQPDPTERAQLEIMPKIVRLDEQLLDLKQLLRTQQAQYGEHHRIVEQTRDQINAAQAERKAAMDKELLQLQAYRLQQAAQNVEAIKAQIAALQPKLQAAAARMTDLQNKINAYNDLKTQLVTAQEKRDQADNSLSQLRMAIARPDAIRVTPQIGATDPLLTFPRAEVIVPGVTILLLGVVGGLLFLRELLDQRVKTPQDVQLLPETNLLGVLPDIGEDPSGSHKIVRIVQQHPAGLVAESFRQVRTAILARMDRRGYKTLMVVAAQPGSGASAVAYNVATSLALNGRRVLILDANFRRPAQHQLARVDNDHGLIDALHGEDVAPLIHPIDDLTLSVLPAGHAAEAPPELLESERFRDLLGQLEATYDMIVIDAPPALLTSDALLLAKQVDAIAMVARATTDKRGMVQRMIRRLDGHRADLLGLVLNGVRSSAGGYFRKSYQDFYRYQSQDSRAAANGKARAKSNGKADANGRTARALVEADTDADEPTIGSGRE